MGNNLWCVKESYRSPSPDLVVGCASEYRTPRETGLGKWGAESQVPHRDRWGVDHEVPGVIFSSQGLSNYPNPSYKDFLAIAIDMVPDTSRACKPPKADINIKMPSKKGWKALAIFS